MDVAEVAERQGRARAVPEVLLHLEGPLGVLERLRVVPERLVDDADVAERRGRARAILMGLVDPEESLPRGKRPLKVRAEERAPARLVQCSRSLDEPADPVRRVRGDEERRRALLEPSERGEGQAPTERAADADHIDARRRVGRSEQVERVLGLPFGEGRVRRRERTARHLVPGHAPAGRDVDGQLLDVHPRRRFRERVGRVELAAAHELVGDEPRVGVVLHGQILQPGVVQGTDRGEHRVSRLLGRGRRSGLRRGRGGGLPPRRGPRRLCVVGMGDAADQADENERQPSPHTPPPPETLPQGLRTAQGPGGSEHRHATARPCLAR